MRNSLPGRVLLVAVVLASVLTPPLAIADDGCAIRGTVINLAGRPVDGVAVTLAKPVRTVLSDAEGRYSIPGLQPGSYDVLIRAAGYADLRVTVEILPSGNGAPLDVTLEPMFRAEIVVTATRTNRALADVPIRVEIVTRDDIEKVDARTLADAVEYSSGVYVESNCQNCNFSQVRLLGLDGAYSQILVDSQPVMSSLAAVYGIEQIPAEMIQRLEIVKGGGSALYGSGAVGGVINVIPREPAVNGGAIEMKFTKNDYQTSESRPESIHGSIDLVSADGKTSFTAFGQSDRIAPLDVTGDGYTEVALRELNALGFRLCQEVGSAEKGRLSLDVSRIKENRRGGNKLDLPPDQADLAEAIISERASAALNWRHQTGKFFNYLLTVAFANTDRDTYYGSGQDPNAYGETKNPLLILDAQFNHLAGSHTLTWGTQYSRDHVEDVQPAYLRFTDETYTNVGLYLQDDWDINSKWDVLWGARVDDHSEVTNPILSPRAAVKCAPIKELNLRGSVASGFRAPQVFNEDLHITQVGGEGQVIRNSDDLREESSLSTMFGVEWLPTVGMRFARLEANLFHTKIEDQFHIIEDDNPLTPDQFELTRVNLGNAKVYGLEINGDISITRQVTLSAGFVIQRSVFGEPEPDFGSTEFFRTPTQYGLLGIDWDIPRIADLFLAAKYTGSMRVPHYIFDPVTGDEIDRVLETTGEFLTWDVSLSRDFPLGKKGALGVTVGIKNITDEYQSDLDQGEFRDSGYVYGPRFPRRFYLAVGYSY